MRSSLIAAVLLCVVATTSAQAQQYVPKGESPFARVAAETKVVVPDARSASPFPSELGERDLEDLAKYIVWQRQFARESWAWHLFSTKLLMVFVLAILGFGLVITYMQFTRQMRNEERRLRLAIVAAKVATSVPANTPVSDTLPPADSSSSPSSVKIGPGGLEVTSQVIGLLVLAFSLAFFYLYVKEVYPMQEGELQRHAKQAEVSSGAGGDNK